MLSINNLDIPSCCSSLQRSMDPISSFIVKSKNSYGPKYHHILNTFEDYLERDGWDEYETMKDDIIGDEADSVIFANFFEKHKQIDLFTKIKADLGGMTSPGHKLAGNQKFLRAEHFKNLYNSAVAEHVHQDLQCLSHICTQVTQLLALDKISCQAQVPLSEHLITKYHQLSMNQGLSLAEFIEKCGILKELQMCNDCNDCNSSKYSKMIRDYVEWYEKNVYKPLVQENDQLDHPINHDINVVIDYLTEINTALYLNKYLKVNPVQLDVCFVPPNTDLSQFHLDDLPDMVMSDKTTEADVDLKYSAGRLIRKANDEMSLVHGDRLIMLICRQDAYNNDNDRIYLFKADPTRNYNVAKPYATHSELPWINNTKQDIVPGLSSIDNGILTISHHIHNAECEKVYASYEGFGSRVLKNDLINVLPNLFKTGPFSKITPKTIQLFKQSFECFGEESDFRDSKFADLGEYYFSPLRYDVFTPGWSDGKPRAMSNVHIAKESTHSLLNVITDEFADSKCLYQHLDYSFAMQKQDLGMNYLNFYKKGLKSILILATELHSKNKKDGNPELYAICVSNSHKKSKQRWKLVEFLSEASILKKYKAIHKRDLPVGSRKRHCNFKDEMKRIEITKQLIRETKWKNVRIIQSKHNKNNNDGSNNGHLKVNATKLADKIGEAFNPSDQRNVIPTISFKFNKIKTYYYVEKLLPFQFSDNQWMAVTFRYKNGCNKTEVSAICLDLYDCRNKAALISCSNGKKLNPIMDCNKNIQSLKIDNNKNNNKCNVVKSMQQKPLPINTSNVNPMVYYQTVPTPQIYYYTPPVTPVIQYQ